MGETTKEQCGSFFSGDCAKIMGEMKQFCTDMAVNRKEFAEKYPHMARMAGRFSGMMSGNCCGTRNK